MNSLASQPVVFEVLQTAADELLMHVQDERNRGTDLNGWMISLSSKVADVFLGKNKNYEGDPMWNVPGKIDEWIVSQLPMGVTDPKERIQMLILQFFSDLFDIANFANTPGVLPEQWKQSWTDCFIQYCMLLMGVPELDDAVGSYGVAKEIPESRLSGRQKQLLERWKDYP